MTKDVSDYKSPPHKVIAFLKEGRDSLRVKYRQLRVDLRRAENHIRSLTKSRDTWRQRAEVAEAELRRPKKKSLPR
jgi:hypothetical protein